MSARWLGVFLDRLDPKRMYFIEADEAEFRRDENRLGDLAKAGDFQFPRSVRQRYAKRVREAASYSAQSLRCTTTTPSTRIFRSALPAMRPVRASCGSAGDCGSSSSC